MGNAKHTPGPIELSEGNTSLWITSPLNARVRIANIIQHSPMNGIDSNAYAVLFAAAPDMAEALNDAATWLKHAAAELENGHDRIHVINHLRKHAEEARATLAKAGVQ